MARSPSLPILKKVPVGTAIDPKPKNKPKKSAQIPFKLILE
jgi:hypothetical protein